MQRQQKYYRLLKVLLILMLTNTPLSFQKTHAIKKELNACHKLLSRFFKACSSKVRPKY